MHTHAHTYTHMHTHAHTSTHLVIKAGALTVLGERGKALVDEFDIVSVDVKAEKHQTSSGHTTNAVQKLEGLQNEVIWGLTVGLLPEVVLM